jgi:hypothetical protein
VLSLGRGVLLLYGVVVATTRTNLCASLVLGFLHCILILRSGSWLDYFWT